MRCRNSASLRVADSPASRCSPWLWHRWCGWAQTTCRCYHRGTIRTRPLPGCPLGDFLRRRALPRPGTEHADDPFDFDTLRPLPRLSGLTRTRSHPRREGPLAWGPQQLPRPTIDPRLLDGLAHDDCEFVGTSPHKRRRKAQSPSGLVLVFHRRSSIVT